MGTRLSTAIAAAALTAAAVAFAGDDANTLPANPEEALARAKPLIEAARKAKSAETPEIAKGVRRAVDLMQPFAKGPTRTYAFDVTQYLDTTADDAPCDAWQKSVEDPELEAVLATLDEVKNSK